MKGFRHRLLLGTCLLVAMVRAQEVQLGADVVSRYIWRGTDFGESMSVQPGLHLTVGALTVGTWASYAITASGAGANEHDLYVSVRLGAVSVGVTDYYFPAPGGPGFFNFDDNGEGAHYLEPFIQFNGPENMPFSLFAGFFAYNDPDRSIYLEGQLPFEINGVAMGLTVGVVTGESGFYNTGGVALVNLGLSAMREIPLTEAFRLPVFVRYILNPNPRVARSYLVFGFRL
ncbi:MAG: TorF family putative porin [Rhodothermus sp.]|nr:TorF family putative porin [Rhodothermus sp.]